MHVYSGRFWNVLEFQSFHWFLGAVPYFDQQAVLCNAEHGAMGTVKWTVASPRANLKGISNQNQDSCYSYHSESRSDAVITRNSYMIPGIVKCWEYCGSESVLWGGNCFFVGCRGKIFKRLKDRWIFFIVIEKIIVWRYLATTVILWWVQTLQKICSSLGTDKLNYF